MRPAGGSGILMAAANLRVAHVGSAVRRLMRRIASRCWVLEYGVEEAREAHQIAGRHLHAAGCSVCLYALSVARRVG